METEFNLMNLKMYSKLIVLSGLMLATPAVFADTGGHTYNTPEVASTAVLAGLAFGAIAAFRKFTGGSR